MQRLLNKERPEPGSISLKLEAISQGNNVPSRAQCFQLWNTFLLVTFFLLAGCSHFRDLPQEEAGDATDTVQSDAVQDQDSKQPELDIEQPSDDTTVDSENASDSTEDAEAVEGDSSKPPKTTGVTCSQDSECASDFCVKGPSGKTMCSKECTEDTDCPQNWKCRMKASLDKNEESMLCVPGANICGCEGKFCGDDGCGNSCGVCNPGSGCVSGVCVKGCFNECEEIGALICAAKVIMECGDFDEDPCYELSAVSTCGSNEACENGSCVCVPNCEDKNCGSNGCGGTCGECADGVTCQDGVCPCTADCAGKFCGSNGCGGFCSGNKNCGTIDYLGPNGDAWISKAIEANSPHAPKLAIQAAFYATNNKKVWVLTKSTFHVLNHQNWVWEDSGLRKTIFPELDGYDLATAYSQTTQNELGEFIFVSTKSAKPETHKYFLNNEDYNTAVFGVPLPFAQWFTTEDTLGIGASVDYTNIVAIMSVETAKNGTPGYTSLNKIAAKMVCPDHPDVGEGWGTYLILFTSGGNAYFWDQAICYDYVASIPSSKLDYFTQGKAPNPAMIDAAVYTDNLMITFTSPN